MEEVTESTSIRKRLPDEREGVTHHFRISDRTGNITSGYIQTGVYENGKLGELFIKIGKPGDESAVWDQFAVLFSMGLQYGIAVETLCAKFIGTRFEPSGSCSNLDIPRCTSIADYIARFIMLKFGAKADA